MERMEAVEGAGEGVGDEVAAKMLLGLSPVGHFLEIFCMAMQTLDALETEGFAQFAMGARNIDPKAAINPAYAYLTCVPAWKRVAPELARELSRRSPGGAPRTLPRPTPNGRR